ncbi:TonB-dependent receptor plug domain-containing protein [Alkalimonas sp. MEB108]|uniref:TonB-dependent receptor plug domain-containing protein n=1 Tax=Alkalimonas cellulosilytica TaxID=3058395 RepID=A0ABU7J8M4_9GAMM|nr:TonB-dependent receptor plug domain-containing protein [Alkalimonas sp. MEB108]MEE2002888.1 TonB-dependent receptor plug domain-containing protein [Alkalimonas sp. MEB108]
MTKKSKQRANFKVLTSVSLIMAAMPGITEEVGAITAEEEKIEKIAVVGSRVQGLAEDALPVSIMSSDEIASLGVTNMQDLLSFIPSVGDFEFNDANTGTNGARGDVAGVNLRSLGTGNTLTLLNGRRMVVHPTFENKNGVPSILYNVNSIPSSAISRIEVLRDGASALYGADATGGVVNLVPFDTFQGFMNRTGKFGGGFV